ncbi:MAG: sulfite exporter TauE/SafE family protein [Thermomicrobiales bacterium]
MTTRLRQVLLFPILVAFLVVWAFPSPSAAHPADELLQHLQVDLSPKSIEITISIGGGVLAKEFLIADLDQDQNGAASAAEIATWSQKFVQHLAISIDRRPIPLDPAKASVTVPDLQAFHAGVQPIEVRFRFPAIAPADVEQLMIVSNTYRALRSSYTFAVSTSDGIGIVSQGWPSAENRVAYGLGIGSPAEKSEISASALASTRLGARAAELFGRERTPTFFLVLLSTFAVVGALHAAQPGHGKALVAGYLVATQGTMRDAFALAGIVTFTHTAGVFALGGLTIAASAIFLPSRVVPIMQVVSALLVIGLGLSLIRRAYLGIRHKHVHAHDAHHHHDHDHAHHHHHHDHASLTDEEHARLHLEEALALRDRTSLRDLLALGIAGGIVPCPEALAILLLAIGLHQAWLGMISIVAFSLGLAAVLVAFGAVVAFVQSRSSTMLQRLPGGDASVPGRTVATAARLLPLASAVLITTVGVVMLLAELD